MRIGWIELCCAVLACLCCELEGAGFVYEDFNVTTGLELFGDARTSSCEERDTEKSQPGYAYSDKHGKETDIGEGSRIEHYKDGVEDVEQVIVETIDGTEESLGGFGHREEAWSKGSKLSDKGDCSVRLRLTPSRRDMTGATWRAEAAQVLQGFTTKFTFKVTGLSKACSIVRDASFSMQKYRSCSVHGGDGFAFVLRGIENEDFSGVGTGDKQLGFGSLKNALAVAFDIWYNPELGDLVEDHVTVFSNGPDAVEARQEHRVTNPRPHVIADGSVHSVLIKYYPYLNTDLLPYFDSAPNAVEYMKDNGEGFRVGVLAVWIDGAEEPLVASPVNLSTLLKLDAGQAIAGFTASTGRSWATQEILSWSFCETHLDQECV